MSWYDAFVPPEYDSVKAFWNKGVEQGDWQGAGEDILASQSGHLGSYLKKDQEGKDDIRKGYAYAIKSLGDLANESKRFHM